MDVGAMSRRILSIADIRSYHFAKGIDVEMALLFGDK